MTEKPISKPECTLYSNSSTKKYPIFESKSRFVMIKIMPVVPSKPIMQEKEETLPVHYWWLNFHFPYEHNSAATYGSAHTLSSTALDF